MLAATGGDAFLKSILGAALHLRVTKMVVATTLAAFATSSPELSVSSIAALAGQPEIGLGDALGSNVVNIALIFGLALLYGPVQTARADFGHDFYLAVGIPLRHRDRVVAIETGELSLGKSLFLGVLGLGALIAAGRLFVSGATGVAANLGVDTYVIGVALVAIGTSLPELVTVILSRLRGHDEVGVGTLIGSNLFNGLFIVGVACTIHPIAAPREEVALTLSAGIVALLLLLPNRSGCIVRARGVGLLLVYAGFIWATLS